VAKNKPALGKGLAALIGESRLAGDELAEGVAGTRLRDLPLGEIAVNRHQPRRAFDIAELQELADSIRHLGVVQPVVVRPLVADTAAGAAQKYELIAGERRLRAAGMAGMRSIPALVRPADEAASLEIALAENVAREDLNSIEEAFAYAALVDQFGLTHERIGELVGRSRAAVSNILRLLELPDEVQTMVEDGRLSQGHARAILGLEAHEERRRVARAVVRQGLTVRQTEELVRRLAGGREAPPASKPADPALDDLRDELYGLLEAPVRIRSGARGGSVEIRFKDQAELERLVQLLRTLGR
jgi:ParB family transcriptional regulator, chromosome partitioning protein